MNGLGMDNYSTELYAFARAGDKTGLAVLLDRHGIKNFMITNGLFLRASHKKVCSPQRFGALKFLKLI